jgi:4-methyl-5(b-hydroxyethyl)-thiazole monophosphate biosynthesis
MATQRILVPLADGFEELEAVTIVDVLRRAGLDVVTAGLRAGPVRGAHGIAVQPDAELSKVDGASFQMMVLPGGMPGAENLKQDARVIALLRELHGSGRHVAAICAAPMVLAHAGLLTGQPATAYPGFREKLTGAKVVEDQRVVKAGRVTTSQGPGTALEFALALVRELRGGGVADELARGMLVRA